MSGSTNAVSVRTKSSIRRFARFVSGSGFPVELQGKNGLELPFFKVKDLKTAGHEGVLAVAEDTISRGTAQQLHANIIPRGSLVFAKVGAALLLGRVGVLPADGCIDNNMAAVVITSHIDPKFARYLMSTFSFERNVLPGPVPSLDMEALREFRIPVLPLDEQRAIADYLDQETAQIDALVAKQEDFIGLLWERRQSQISDNFAALGSPNTQLRRVAQIQTGITLSGDGDPTHPRWPYLRVANVQMGKVDLSHVKEIHLPQAEAATSMLRAGDVLMTEGGDIDKLGRGTVWDGSVERMVHQNHVFAVRAKLGRLMPAFLAWWLDTSIAREYFYLTAKKTTNLASTNKTVVGRLPIHVPDLSRQDETVRRICEQTTRIDALIAKVEEHIALAKERRSALITAAVTGQFDVRTGKKGARA